MGGVCGPLSLELELRCATHARSLKRRRMRQADARNSRARKKHRSDSLTGDNSVRATSLLLPDVKRKAGNFGLLLGPRF